jgi:3-oxoacyl-[acyl-carrier protein] reductase
LRLAGKTALVTGAGSGFGAAIARRFAQEGARVIAVDIDEAAARKIAAGLPTHGGEHVAAQCDVANGASVAAMVAKVVAAAGGFDILVNNAGLTQRPMRIARIGEAELDRLIAVNVKSLYHMAVHALPVLRKRGGGAVINIASVSAMRPRPGMTWYNATKAAVIVITQTMAAELAPDRIRVNAIARPSVARRCSTRCSPTSATPPRRSSSRRFRSVGCASPRMSPPRRYTSRPTTRATSQGRSCLSTAGGPSRNGGPFRVAGWVTIAQPEPSSSLAPPISPPRSRGRPLFKPPAPWSHSS